jgi:hypothetical protein
MTTGQDASRTVSMLFITDERGNVVAAAHRGSGSVPGQNVGINPLPGQRIHEIEVPEPIARLGGRDFHLFVSQARFEVRAAELKFPEVRVKRHDEED